MPIGSNNEFPSVLIKEGTAPATPASGDQRLYIKSADHLPYLINSAGTSTVIGGGGSGAMTQIQKITNGSTAAMTFTSIPGTYNALLLVLQARLSSASGVAYQLMQLNGDTGANYSYNNIFFNSTVFGSSAISQTSTRVAYLPDTTATANFAGLSQILIPNYAGTSFFKNWTAQVFGTLDNVAVDQATALLAGQWASTAAITQISLISTMLVNSVGCLYGIS